MNENPRPLPVDADAVLWADGSVLRSTNGPVLPLNKLQQRDPDHPVVIADVRDMWSI